MPKAPRTPKRTEDKVQQPQVVARAELVSLEDDAEQDEARSFITREDLLYERPGEEVEEQAQKWHARVTRMQARVARLRDQVKREGTAGASVTKLGELAKAEDDLDREYRKGTAQVDPFRYMVRLGVVLAPYIDPKKCCETVESSDALSTCVAAMAVNVGGHGYDLVPALDDDAIAELDQATKSQMDLEKKRLENFFNFASPDYSFLQLCEMRTWDKESTGYACIEIIEREQPDENGNDIAGLSHMPSWQVRLTPEDDFVDAEVFQLDEHGKWIKVTHERRFRRVVQVVNGQYRWFKMLGDPRAINRYSGAIAASDAEAKEWEEKGELANRVIFTSIYNPLTPYGAPRWLGAVSSAMGRKQAGEVNLLYFSNKAIPPMAVLVSGGALTKESMVALKERFKKLKGIQSYHDVLIIETIPSGAIDPMDPMGKTAVRVELKPLTEAQQKDGLFKEYRADCREDVRTSFRLPPIVTGLAEDFNYATAQSSMEVAEQQVFQPERGKEDHLINHLLLPAMGIRFWKFRSRGAKASDETATGAILQTANAALAITPNEVRRIISGMLAIDLPPINEPWASQPAMMTLQQLQAQVAQARGGMMGQPSGPSMGLKGMPPAAGNALEQAKQTIATMLHHGTTNLDKVAAAAPPPGHQVGQPSRPGQDADVAAAQTAAGEHKPTTDDDRSDPELRFHVLRMPAELFSGSEVINGVIQVSERAQREIAKRFKLAQARRRAEDLVRVANGSR